MSTYVVLVTDKALGGCTPYGPYRSHQRATAASEAFRNVNAREYHDPEEYDVYVSLVRKSPNDG